jgi:hypothetical protein
MGSPLYDRSHGIVVVALTNIKSVKLGVLRLEVLVLCVQNLVELLKQFYVQVEKELWLFEFLEI